MRNLKKTLKKLFLLPPAPTILIALPSFALLILVFVKEIDGAVAYLAYLLSAYALAILIAGFPRIVRVLRRRIENLSILKLLKKLPIVGRYMDDPLFRAEASLYTGFLINLAYAAIKLVSGIRYRSLWFAALSVYYLFLSVLRYLLLHHVRRNAAGRAYAAELRRYRLCGVVLIVMNLALSAIVTLVVVWDRGFEYGGYLIYVMAAYTFYMTIKAIVNTVKFRKYKSPILSAAKAVDLTAALVSMLSLETAMLSQFGNGDGTFRKTVTAITGLCVCLFVLGAAVFMIISSTRKLNLLKKSGGREA
ncbi:MAG: hypothetical protein NC084_10010 [Bacteroides sp.]|nr:hypothetical protein [Eubacterium sp.]MCM1419200.1 hypothetical protein [Roseburia sp.]MCM1463033.1 hypothetical protein [Bacteroides sp.]